MGKFLNKKNIDNSNLLSFLFRSYTKLNYLLYSDKKFMNLAYKKRFNRNIDWENPQTFQEKLQWLKLHHRTHVQTICADKIAVREYIKEKIGEEYLIPQLQILGEAKELIPEKLPDFPFIIKCNHNSGAYTIVKNKNSINWKKERKRYNNLLKQNYYYQGREWQYKHITPKIIIEKLLLDEKGQIPLDYKFYCFNGIPHYINVSTKYNDKHYFTFYDLNWELTDLKYERYPNDIPFEVQKPKKLDDMLILAKQLAKGFCFARIDFYYMNESIYFGEITLHPSSGYEIYMPDYYNDDLGKLTDISHLL